jgi:glutamate synthase (ferredoxin)
VNEIIRDQVDKVTGMTADYAITNYNKVIAKGILKIMNKIGILLYIRIALPNFEILGLNKNFTSKYFHTPSRIEGIGLIEVEKKLRKGIRKAFPNSSVASLLSL